MNILHIGNVAIEANGVGQVITNLTLTQRKLGHEVRALTVRHKREPLPLFTEVHTINDFSKIVQDFAPDIFVFHSLYLWEYIKFYKYLRKQHIPFLIQLHGALSVENYKKSHFKKMMANLLFYKKFLKKAERIIYLNEGEYSKSLVKEINDRSVIIPNGCHLPEPRPPHPISDNRVEILYLGRMDMYHKALDVLLKAIHCLEQKGLAKKVHFTFYGNGLPEQIKTFTEAIGGIGSIVDFRGSAYGEVKENAYNQAHIFILTSRFEGMPMGILEALAHGLPCIVTPQTNMAQIIIDNKCGWVTEVDDMAIAATIEKAIYDYKINHVHLHEASIAAACKYSWDEIAARAVTVYSETIQEYAENRR